MMNTESGPDMNCIGGIVSAWQRGVLTFEEAKQRLEWSMDPSHFLPEAEQISELPPGESAKSLEFLKRIEHKFNLVIQHQSIPFPDELNPAILGEEARKLADENQKIFAVQTHREKTGAGFVEAKKALDRYLQQKRL